MSTLHLLSSSPFDGSRFASCLRLLAPGDGLLLCGDGVYALRAPSAQAEALTQLEASIRIYALDEDVQARALRPLERVQSVDYPGFVALTCRFHKVNSWL
jgi:tRNA 2-thiouridine synthesizing protein B